MQIFRKKAGIPARTRARLLIIHELSRFFMQLPHGSVKIWKEWIYLELRIERSRIERKFIRDFYVYSSDRMRGHLPRRLILKESVFVHNDWFVLWRPANSAKFSFDYSCAIDGICSCSRHNIRGQHGRGVVLRRVRDQTGALHAVHVKLYDNAIDGFHLPRKRPIGPMHIGRSGKGRCME